MPMRTRRNNLLNKLLRERHGFQKEEDIKELLEITHNDVEIKIPFNYGFLNGYVFKEGSLLNVAISGNISSADAQILDINGLENNIIVNAEDYPGVFDECTFTQRYPIFCWKINPNNEQETIIHPFIQLHIGNGGLRFMQLQSLSGPIEFRNFKGQNCDVQYFANFTYMCDTSK